MVIFETCYLLKTLVYLLLLKTYFNNFLLLLLAKKLVARTETCLYVLKKDEKISNMWSVIL